VKREPAYIPALSFHTLTPLYDPLVALTTRERTFKRALIQLADVRAGQRVLDVGCGTGTLAIWLWQAAPGSSVTGLDADASMLARARDKARRADATIRFDRALSSALPYPDGSFDKVVSSLFFHHLDAAGKRATLREVHRVLAPGGALYMADWGKPGALLRIMFYAVQLLDGFESTRDNVEGRLPQFFTEAGFHRAALVNEVATILGTIGLYSAVKRL
jgi:ubiquinone/menaquinone biosynthesis C-methylase UbiE